MCYYTLEVWLCCHQAPTVSYLAPCAAAMAELERCDNEGILFVWADDCGPNMGRIIVIERSYLCPGCQSIVNDDWTYTGNTSSST